MLERIFSTTTAADELRDPTVEELQGRLKKFILLLNIDSGMVPSFFQKQKADKSLFGPRVKGNFRWALKVWTVAHGTKNTSTKTRTPIATTTTTPGCEKSELNQ